LAQHIPLAKNKAISQPIMTEEQKGLVKKTWQVLRNIDPVLLGDVFYSRLFIQYPELKLLFKEPLESQYKKLIAMLGFVASHVDRLDELAPEIEALGKRHVHYGVKPAHYGAVGEALLWTLQTGLGRDWTQEIAQAWAAFYGAIAQKMQEPAEQKQLN
jgi:hemoglobin-like flavoprotein